jgi:hypothetical protein
MMYLNENDVEVIFDPVSKGATIRRGECTAQLEGPFSNFFAAMLAAREYLDRLDADVRRRRESLRIC